MKKKLIILIITLTLSIILFQAFDLYHRVLKAYYPDTYSAEVEKYSKKYGIEKHWIYALIKAESNFKKDSISRKRSSRPNATNGKHSPRSFKRNPE